MAVWDKKTLWSFMLMLAGAVSVGVNYPPPVCAVKGSTVTLPCTFTPLQSVNEGGREVLIELIRVRWCQNHEICQGSIPSVYDSNSVTNDPRYKYLGDMKGNCTLQITDIQKRDEATLRFRMEANDNRGHFTGRSGVKVTVTDQTLMKINSSRGDREMRRGETVTLYCTALCTYHQLEVTWFRDGHALSESGPALQLGHLTAEDSGNYTCGLKANVRTRSPPYSLHVEAEEEETSTESGAAGTSDTPDVPQGTTSGTVDKLMAVRLVLFTLYTVLIVIVVSIVIKRTCLKESSCCSRKLKHETVQPPDFVEEL